jgi:hypothetical protein
MTSKVLILFDNFHSYVAIKTLESLVLISPLLIIGAILIKILI